MNRNARIFITVLAALAVVLGVQLAVQLRLTQAARARASRITITDEQAIERVRWLAQDQRREWNNAFLGIPINQYPADLMISQYLVFSGRPDTVIETGTAFGGLTVYLSILLENINDRGQVLSVDIAPGNGERVLRSPQIRQTLKDRIRFFQGSSTDPAIVEQMAALAKGKKVMLILDSLHSKEYVRKELET